MLWPSRKALLALEAVVDVAYHARPGPVQSKEITRRQGIPERHLEPVMQQLVRGGVLRGVRGPRGGYSLARERRRITVGEVVRIFLEPEKGRDEDVDDAGSALGRLVVRPLCAEVEAEVIDRLNAITIEELCGRADAAGIDGGGREATDFTI